MGRITNEFDPKSHRLHRISPSEILLLVPPFPNSHRLSVSNQKLDRKVLTLLLPGSPFASLVAGSSVTFPVAAAASLSAMNQLKPRERKQGREMQALPHASCGRAAAWCGEMGKRSGGRVGWT
ncbi:hypothetical protein PR202_gb10424 [Eleusine coracana subsp. coracana]|uniref:Uncharacterized protein n=1 Tax=Eleusine coracana subsp. coracana TaxID=191504 RepID=A0AAV5EKP3_ELECO|nr:hypothetical protein PR202_gb10424 [Eleusine coracana subsp. coracana]